GIERGLVLLVFQEQPPRVRHGPVDFSETVQISIEGTARVHLAGKIASVSYPDRERVGTERFPDLDALEIVVDGLTPDIRVNMREASEFIGQALVRLVLKRIGVHRVDG